MQCDTGWRGTLEGFLSSWSSKMEQYIDICKDNEIPNDLSQLQMLQKAVRLIPQLESVRGQNDTEITMGHPPLTYDKYYGLLLCNAQTVDSYSSTSTRNSQQASLHEVKEQICANLHEVEDQSYFDCDDGADHITDPAILVGTDGEQTRDMHA